jgi:nucleotide-binding universal stress UspA family protein
LFKSILVAVDGSEPAQRAIGLASGLAVTFDASLTLLHVQGRPGRAAVPREFKSYARIEHVELTEADMLRQAGEELIARAEALARSAGAKRVTTLFETGDPASRISENARAGGFDLLVMGRRGLGDLSGLLLGSVSHKVAQLAPCAVLTMA